MTEPGPSAPAAHNKDQNTSHNAAFSALMSDHQHVRLTLELMTTKFYAVVSNNLFGKQVKYFGLCLFEVIDAFVSLQLSRINRTL